MSGITHRGGKLWTRYLEAKDVVVGFHQDGYRIDKTAAPMNRYTKWEIISGRGWCDPKPVCFDSLPEKGWVAIDKFNWNKPNIISVEYA